MKPVVHFFGGQGIGWALDEDLNRARGAVEGRVRIGSFARSPIIHSAWWPPLLNVGREALRGKSVVCFADNPPAFYLTRPGFEAAASRVDLWIARSQEALRQFQELGLPVTLAPYSVDPKIFHPLLPNERNQIRLGLGLHEGDFVVGNFHRDSLEKDLSLPKAQKGPDLFVELADQARKEIPNLKVLLAGPRRHWLREELSRRDIPFVFSGKVLPGDDFSVNVLPRGELNRLYGALDCVLISSRWEGGPYAALEALFSARPVISTPVGMSSDLLGEWLYSTPDEGAEQLARIARTGADISSLREKALESHSSAALGDALCAAYAGFAEKSKGGDTMAKTFSSLVLARLHGVFRKSLGIHPGVAAVMENVRRGEPGGLRVAAEAVVIAGAERAIAKA